MVILKALFLSTLLLVSISFSLANHHEDPSQQMEQCQRRCQEETPRGLKQQQQCQQECREKMQQQGGHGGGGRTPFTRDPEQKFEQCMESCQSRQHGGQQQQQCRQQCGQQMSQHERQQLCQQRCQRQQQTGEQMQPCQRRCESQFEQQGEELEINMSRETEQQFEECQQSCRSRQHGSQQQRQCSQQCAQHTCQQHCQRQERGDWGKQRQCQERCMQQLQQGEELEINTSRDPEQKLEQCQQSCQSRQQGQQMQQQCRQQCAQQLSQRERQQICQQHCEMQDSHCQRRCMEQLEQGEQDMNTSRDPQQKLEQCQQSCQSRQQGQQQCRQQCARQLSQRERQQICDQHCQTRQRGDQQQCQRRCQQQLEEGQGLNNRNKRMHQQMNNPYYFPSDMFQEKFRSEEGRMYVLEKFTKNQNKLLRGIRNYRLAIFEAEPNTFILPHHCDAESIFVVIQGRCTCTMLIQDNKESLKMEKGDVLRVPAGAIVYLVNNNNYMQTLRIAKFKQPVNTPGRFEDFFAASSQDVDSYFNVFSEGFLESAFNTPSDQIQRVFGQKQQRSQGMVMRATPQQLQALSEHAKSKGKGLFNIRDVNPTEANEFGKVFEARPEKFDQLQDMDVSVSCIEINNEAMMLPHYNSKAVFVVLVVEGNGRIEMACPHMASQSQMGEEEAEEQSGRMMQVTADISEGDVFVVPAGHPIAIVSQSNNNERGGYNQLKMLGFGINAQNNKRSYIAGKGANPIREMDRSAKQLTFGQEMEVIINMQRQSYFAPIRQRGRDEPLSSVLAV